MKKNIRLADFVKKNITLAEKVYIINMWEADRCCAGECIFDLDDNYDAISWIELYGVANLCACREIGKYWMGGASFHCNGANTDGTCVECWMVDEFSLATRFTEENLIGEIKDTFESALNEFNTPMECAEYFNALYHSNIDFIGFAKAMTTKYKWVAVCEDGNETMDSKCFDNIEDCYNDMRDAALKKMSCNTDLSDLSDVPNGEFIRYEVRFFKDKIAHESDSGRYIYKIVNDDTLLDRVFFNNLIEEVKRVI